MWKRMKIHSVMRKRTPTERKKSTIFIDVLLSNENMKHYLPI